MALSDIPFFQAQQSTPLGSTNWSGNTITTQYDPRLLEDFFATVDQRQNQRNVYGTAAQNAYEAMTGPNADPRAGLPALQSSLDPSQLQSGYSREGFVGIPGANGFAGERQRVEDALYDRFASRADRGYGQQQTALENQLRDQGFQPGTEGWDAAMQTFGENRNDAYQAAVRDAVAGGGAEQSRMLADALRIRGQQGAESQQDLGNWNNAATTNFTQQLASGQFGNQARQQGFGENVTSQQMPLQWLQTAQGALPQGTMLPQFDMGLRGLDEDQASRNAWTAGLESLLGPLLSGGGAGGAGGGGGWLGSLISGGLSGLGNLFGGGSSWLDSLLNPAMDPEGAYGPDSGWGNDLLGGGEVDPSMFEGWDPSWFEGWE
jgi:hypothetical protein